MIVSLAELDERDQAIVLERAASLKDNGKPQVGDFVMFADGVERRVSHVWDWSDGSTASIQTSTDGHFYLGDGYVSFSGALFIGVGADTFTGDSADIKDGSVWIFHHDHKVAGGGVDTRIAFRVWNCSLDSRTI